MRFAQLKSLLRPLRAQLTAWNTAVVLLTVVITLIGVHVGLRLTLRREFDKELLDDSLEVSQAVERFYPQLPRIFDEMERKVASHADRRLFVQLFNPDGTVLWESKTPDLSDLVIANSNRTQLAASGDYHLAQRKIERSDLPAYTVRVGASLSGVNDDVWTVTRLMILAAAVILFVAPLGGYWLARRATSPIADIISTAARLRPSYLEERLPIRGAGDELDHLSQTINRFLDLIADYLQRNREFIANAAHELRSPLAAIQSSVEVCLNSERTTSEYQDQLYDIGDQCHDLVALVNQLLLLAETDAAGQVIQHRPVRLDRLVEKSVDMFRGAAEERGIQLVTGELSQFMLDADGDRLRQVIQNLIDNSLKFTQRGGEVKVSLRRPAERGRVELEVADTGVGILADDLPHVFERFYRGDKSRQKEDLTRGNGLGLSICKSIVTAHGGSIGVRSVPGAGAVFTVSLPTMNEESIALAQSQAH